MPLYTYATLEMAKSEYAATQDTENPYLLRALRQLTERFESEVSGMDKAVSRTFVPYIKTRYYDAAGDRYVDRGRKRLYLRADLLEATTVIDGNSTTLVSGTDFQLYPRGDIAYGLQGLSAYGGFHQYTDDWVDAISVTGVWGYHTNYDKAWMLAVDTLQAAIVSTTANTITVADTDAVNPRTGYSRFSAGNLIRIDDEYLVVLDTDTDTNVVAVERGANGSTAAIHDNSSNVDVWQPIESVQRVIARAASYHTKRIGDYERATFANAGGVSVTSTFPADLESEWQHTVARLQRIESMGI